ncbi:rab3 GTPase-activating protein catalytic subunit-like isoform X2 [Limulus polyphemus]|uniref:Rab3 GTPase-activating protein catalytic subunit n=1 Tax=Limulus polyphemus TaxID=6850 RepID=A0ABM1SE16_LIMPO|nr:rab3 GTPase-activating protein catalytic subunit-like isoform X2 [Limulus polyphemus]
MASGEEDQDVFEITDFTTASDWERFIARIEEIFHEWKLPTLQQECPLKREELTNGKWEEACEDVMFANFRFLMTRYYLKRDVEPEIKNDELEDQVEVLSSAIEDIISRENDFPARAHCLVRWFGLRDFIVLCPTVGNDIIASENRAKILLSSLCIAINNTNSHVPVFIQLSQRSRRFFLGICEGGGIRTNFEMVHLNKVPQHCNHLAGLLSVFKGKLSCPLQLIPPVDVTIRFTYALHEWSPYSWPQSPPDISDITEDITPSLLGKLPFGALEDPIVELLLFTTWPCLSEDIVVDNDIHSDLDLTQAPAWAVKVRTKDEPACLLGEFLEEFVALCHRKESQQQLLGKLPGEEFDDSNEISQALNKLARPHPIPVTLPNLSAVVSKARPNLHKKSEVSLIDDSLLDKILIFLFPNSVSTLTGDQGSEKNDDFQNCVEEKEMLPAELDDHIRSFKSAPPDSLTWRLALAMCQVNHSYGGIAAVAHLWHEFVLEMRYRWENNFTLPCLEWGAPNLAYCLLHQKLQMLNCCIQRKIAREWQRNQQSFPSTASGSAISLSPQKTEQMNSESEDEEEFFECEDGNENSEIESSMDIDSSPSSEVSVNKKMQLQPEGRLRQCGSLTLLLLDEPLYIPVTQEPAPMTEDILEEHAEVLVQLGTNPEGAALRARMQSACLTSDMEAFKAANPGACLEDFVRWYSPRDWIEEEVYEEGTNTTRIEGHLSPRMQVSGNMWQEAWDNSRPVPARRQKRLFDDTKEAEKILHFLASLKPAMVVHHLLPMVIHAAILLLVDHIPEGPRSLSHTLEQIAAKAARVIRSSEHKYEEILKLICQAEANVACAQSLMSKFCQTESKMKSGSGESGLPQQAEKKKSTKLKQLGTSDETDDDGVWEFVLNILEQPEVDVPGAGKGKLGKLLRRLFAEAQMSTHLEGDEKLEFSGGKHHHYPMIPEFPPPVGREFILRTKTPRPASYSNHSPQRMYCVLSPNEFRLGGAFSEDTTFQ